MIKRSISADPNEDLESNLTISPETVCYVVVKAHEFDVKDVSTGDDTGSSSSDDMMMSVLEDHRDDPVLDELTSFISSLTEDEQIDLVALAWLGRDDNTIEDWPTLREQAARAHGSHGKQTAAYLLGMPMLGDYLEEGLSLFGKSCESFEMNRL
jgi:hypothetical protein